MTECTVLTEPFAAPDPAHVKKDEWTPLVPVPDDALILDVTLNGRKPDRTWPYHDVLAKLIGHACRWNEAEEKKQFRFASWCTNSAGRQAWRLRQLAEPRPLYGLKELAERPDAPVVVVEGEKTANAARAVFLQSVVVTSPCGAKAALKADWKPLAGRKHVLIVADADAPGSAYAMDVAKALGESVGEILIADMASLAAKTPEGATRDPIEGWDIADAMEEGWDGQALRKAISNSAKPYTPGPAFDAALQEAESQPLPIAWPRGFEMRSSGLWRVNDGDKPDTLISGPFAVEGKARDDEGNGWSLVLSWSDDDSTRHTGILPEADLIGDSVEPFKALKTRGLGIPVAALKLKLLKEALDGLRCYRRARLINKTGWHGNTFVLPDQSFGISQERVLYQGQARAALYSRKGPFSEWQEYVASKARGNSRLLLSLSTAFAGPIADLLEEEPCGVHLVGNSSTGKSTALLVAGSVWGGGGRNGFVQTWRLTGNGLEGIAKAHSGALLTLDELAELAASEAAAIAYMLINGQGKARAGRDGEARVRAQWRCMILSSGEIGLADKIEETGRKARQGQLVRFMDIPADAGAGMGLFENCHGQEPSAFSALLKAAALRLYGTAGRCFIDEVAKLPDEVRREAQMKIRELCAAWLPANAEGQLSRVARHFAMIGHSGELARLALDLEWEEGEAIYAAQSCFEAWRKQRGSDGARETGAALNAIGEAIERHGEGRFLRVDSDDGERLNHGAPSQGIFGYRFRHEGRLVFGFTQTGWKEVLRGICDPALAAQSLKEKKLLLVSGSYEAQAQFAKKIEGRTQRLYAFVPYDSEAEGSA